MLALRLVLASRLIEQMSNRVDNRWKAVLGMSSDHAGIDRELRSLQSTLYRVLARTDDARHVRDYLRYLVNVSQEYLLPDAPAPWRK